jgi:hypothetical protein
MIDCCPAAKRFWGACDPAPTVGTMTQRKPPGTSWESWIEAQIRVAMEQGAFDNLPGAGKPLPNLDQEYDPLWWVKQLAQREQLSLLPPSLELLRKVERELATIEKLPDEATLRRRVAALNVEIARLNATVVEGPPTRLGKLDVDQVVARWRRTRSATPR